MLAHQPTELGAEREIVLERLASGHAVDELMRVLVKLGPSRSSSSMDALARLSAETGTEVLAALRGGRPEPPEVDPRSSLFSAFRPRYRAAG